MSGTFKAVFLHDDHNFYEIDELQCLFDVGLGDEQIHLQDNHTVLILALKKCICNSNVIFVLLSDTYHIPI